MPMLVAGTNIIRMIERYDARTPRSAALRQRLTKLDQGCPKQFDLHALVGRERRASHSPFVRLSLSLGNKAVFKPTPSIQEPRSTTPQEVG